MIRQTYPQSLLLRRANASRKGSQWQDEDYDVFDGERGTAGDVGHIFQQGGRGVVLGRRLRPHQPQELWPRRVARMGQGGVPGGVPRIEGDPMTADERRLLEMLAWSEDGVSEALSLARGLSPQTIVNAVRARFATLTAERKLAGRSTVEMTRVRITDAGRRALA
jgi:hypothetical protein